MRLKMLAFGAALGSVLAVAACTPDYSPNTYNAAAVQQANKVEQGVIAGVRDVDVKVAGTTGALVGGAAGGIAGSQVPGSSVASAFGALGGSLIGGIVGSTAERAAGDTRAFEYVVRKTNGELVSVTQKDEIPLVLNQHVLVIAGNQARIVPDYTVAPLVPPLVPPDIARITAVPLPAPATIERAAPDVPQQPALAILALP